MSAFPLRNCAMMKDWRVGFNPSLGGSSLAGGLIRVFDVLTEYTDG
jgi:hypothetical protein